MRPSREHREDEVLEVGQGGVGPQLGVQHRVRVHDLRHAHASWLLAGGADLKSVMDRMGHTHIQTTQKYFHTLPDTNQRNLDALTRIQEQP